MSRKTFTHFLSMSRERITRFLWCVAKKMDPRASSGKRIRVKSRYPESFRFLCLWSTGGQGFATIYFDTIGKMSFGMIWCEAEAQKPKTFRIASFYAQKFSGRSARIHFSRHVKKARNPLSRLIKSAFSLLLWWLGQCDTKKHMQCSSFTLKWIEHLKCKM